MSNKMERRFITAEVRIANDETDYGTITGYAAMYYNGNKKNQSADLGGFRERLAKGCFTRALAQGTAVKCLFNHDSILILARTGNGTLHISSDNKGLLFRCTLGAQSYAQDIRESVRTGLVHECSFGFIMAGDDPDSEAWSLDQDDPETAPYRVRTIQNVAELLDVSVVTSPAYSATSCTARQLFPDGQPEMVLRALQQDADAKLSFARSQRRNLINRIVGQ